jgi:hypothetical protein
VANHRRKAKSVARNNPALLLTGVFGVAGLLASVGAYFLKGSTQEALKMVVPPVIGGTTGYLASSTLKLDKNTRLVTTVLGTALGYVVGNYVQEKRVEDACSGWGSLRPSCLFPSIFGSPVQQIRADLYQPTQEQRAQLEEASKVNA